jgi:hypothetical protein
MEPSSAYRGALALQCPHWCGHRWIESSETSSGSFCIKLTGTTSVIIGLELTSLLLWMLIAFLAGSIAGAIGAMRLYRWIHSSSNVTIVK